MSSRTAASAAGGLGLRKWRHSTAAVSEPVPTNNSDALARAEQANAAGTARYTAGAFDEAIQHYTAALNLLSATAPATIRASLHSNRGACHLALEQWQPALDDSLQAIQCDATVSKAYLRAGKCYLAAGEYNQARRMLRQSKDGGAALVSADVDRCDKLQQLAKKLYASEPTRALNLVAQLLLLTPLNVTAEQIQIQALLATDQLDEAKAIADSHYHRMCPNDTDADVLYMRGLCFFRLGKLDLALKHMQSVLAVSSDYGAASSLLNRIQASLRSQHQGSAAPTATHSAMASVAGAATLGGRAAAASSPIFRLISQLPPVLLPALCSYLQPTELLVSLARTAKTTREQLTPQCFSEHFISLGFSAMTYLAFRKSASLFYARVLSDCQLLMHLYGNALSGNTQQALDSLRHFPACRTICFNAPERMELGDISLQPLLQHPSVRACKELKFHNLVRCKTELGTRALLNTGRGMEHISTWTKDFSWADVRLPSLTSLTLEMSGKPRYVGGAAFLAEHSALRELRLSPLLISIPQLTRLFTRTTALPNLTLLLLDDKEQKTPIDFTALLTALATTSLSSSGKPRPVRSLTLPCLSLEK